MKRILLSALLATGLHLVVFVSMPVLFQEKHKPAQNEIKSVMITMSYRHLEPKKKHPPKKQIKKKKLKKKPAKNIVKKIVKKIKPKQNQVVVNKPVKEPVLPERNKPGLMQKTDIEQPVSRQTINKKDSDIQGKKTLSKKKELLQIAKPVYKNNPLPKYPILAKKRGYEGTVELMVLVSEKGKVSNLWIFKSSNYKSLDNQAVKIVKKWIFEPGKKNEKPEEMWVKIPVTFELKYN